MTAAMGNAAARFMSRPAGTFAQWSSTATSDAPPTWRANPAVKPTIPDHSADASADKKPDAKAADGSPANQRLIDSKHLTDRKAADAKAADAKTADAKSSDSKSTDSKSAKSSPKPVESKPAKPTKPKKDDDLFGTRH